jgi:hypothetical protein
VTQTTDEIVAAIRAQHRKRRYAMKAQSKIDRALESFVRREFTGWRPDLPEAEREKFNKEVARILKAARAGKGDSELVEIVNATDASRETFDGIRAAAEKTMEKKAAELPVFAWTESVPGVGPLGLATIIAETGPLHYYAGPYKVFKRLGFAPYDGCAGSTWKRETWRPRTLSADEWVENPFSGERYAQMAMIAQFLWMKQWKGAAKSETGEGQPTGPYGEIYAARRAHTAQTHPDWSKGHSHSDALRVMMKEFLKDLWCAWTRTLGHEVRVEEFRSHSSSDAHCACAADSAAGPGED